MQSNVAWKHKVLRDVTLDADTDEKWPTNNL